MPPPRASDTSATTRPTAIDGTASISASLMSGRAELQVPQNATGKLTLTFSGDTLHLRAVTLVFRKTGTPDRIERKDFHRSVADGEQLADIPAMLDGARLASIAIVASPGSSARAEITPADRIDATDWSGQRTNARNAIPGTLVASMTVTSASDRIELPIGRQHGPVAQLIVTARGSPVSLSGVQVQRYSADTLSIDGAGTMVGPGAEPLVVRLAEPEAVRSIVLTRRPGNGPDKSVIEVRAISPSDWSGQFGRNRSENGGWTLLGTSTLAAGLQRPQDRGLLRMRGPEGTIQRIRFAAQRQPVRLVSIDLLMPDGRRESVPVNALLTPGKSAEPIKIAPEFARFVALELQPAIHPRATIDAAIEVWVQY